MMMPLGKETVKRTLQVHDALQSSLTALQEAELDQLSPSLPVWQQYMNILLHDAYHTGQIIQLRKLQGSYQLTVLIYKVKF